MSENVFSSIKTRVIYQDSHANEALVQLPDEVDLKAMRLHDSSISTETLSIKHCNNTNDSSQIGIVDDNDKVLANINMAGTIQATELYTTQNTVTPETGNFDTKFQDYLDLGLISKLPTFSLTNVLGWCCKPANAQLSCSGCITSANKDGQNVLLTFKLEFEQYLQTTKCSPFGILLHNAQDTLQGRPSYFRVSTTIGTPDRGDDDIHKIYIQNESNAYFILILGGENNSKLGLLLNSSQTASDAINENNNIFNSNPGRIYDVNGDTEDVVLQLFNDQCAKSDFNIESVQLKNSKIVSESPLSIDDGLFSLNNPMTDLRIDGFTGNILNVKQANLGKNVFSKIEDINKNTWYNYTTASGVAMYPGALLGIAVYGGNNKSFHSGCLITNLAPREGIQYTFQMYISENVYNEVNRLGVEFFTIIAICNYKNEADQIVPQRIVYTTMYVLDGQIIQIRIPTEGGEDGRPKYEPYIDEDHPFIIFLLQKGAESL